MKKILFVCLGNICRSPTAEGVMLQMIAKSPFKDKIMIDSAGTGSWHVGEPPDPRAMHHAAKRGYNLETLRARQFQRDDFEAFDLIVAMDDQNVQNITKLAEKATHHHKVVKLTDYNTSYQYDFVPDPYHEGPDGFELVLDLVEHCCSNLLKKIESEF